MADSVSPGPHDLYPCHRGTGPGDLLGPLGKEASVIDQRRETTG